MSLDELVNKYEDNPWNDFFLIDSSPTHVKMVEFGLDKTLKINPSLPAHQENESCDMLSEHLDAFVRSYKEMKGVHLLVCTHHIYIKEGCKLVCQPQRRMNPTLKDIVRELQKLLDAGCEWVCPLVLVPKKNGKWRICVDYRYLNKGTKK